MRSSSTPASTACEPTAYPVLSIAETCAQMIREQIPNFFRLYLNPYVVGTCFCLGRYVEETWHTSSATKIGYQSFLANSFEEAASGAIKLARYCNNLQGRSPAGLVIDPGGRLGHFASLKLGDESTVEFVPRLVSVRNGAELDLVSRSREQFGFLMFLASSPESWHPRPDALRTFIRAQSPLIITCLDRDALVNYRDNPSYFLLQWIPDIVVFDESFVNQEVPFAAFTARKALYDHWNAIGKGVFHSTTYQPNTISTLHFLKCLERMDPRFYRRISGELGRIRRDSAWCAALLRALYSPSLAKLIAATGFDAANIRASGHYIEMNGRRIFDGVAGIACSIRGHNPESYVDEIRRQGDVCDPQQLVAGRLRELTGLGHMVPAVSGASAVENALRIALTAQHPRRVVVAFKGGFGGKTLLALTGTAKAFYKSHLDPLYENVHYLDPFAIDVLDELEAVLQKYPVGVVQLEVVQAVGGIRPIPLRVLRYLEERKRQGGYLLLVDEVQTGMYRTGPFVLSKQLGLTPDILTIGKGASDMMFPFAFTLYGAAVERRLALVHPDLTRTIHQKFGYEFGYRTALNTLERAEETRLSERVTEAGALFARLLSQRLGSCKAVRDVRIHGLLIGIELDTAGWPRRWLGTRLSSLYILNMLQSSSFPVLIGYCQDEPQVLKLTPPLSITSQEVHRICETIATALHRPWYKLLPAALRARLRS